MATLLFKQYKNDIDYSNKFRPWTLIADLFTGVMQRDEALVYSKALFAKWVEGLKEAELKDADEPMYMAPTGKKMSTRNFPVNELPEYAETIVSRKGGDTPKYGITVRMQRLEYKDGSVRITFKQHVDVGLV